VQLGAWLLENFGVNLCLTVEEHKFAFFFSENFKFTRMFKPTEVNILVCLLFKGC
jgi:hypothetical protein